MIFGRHLGAWERKKIRGKCHVIFWHGKLWDFSEYYERTTSKRSTCHKIALQGKLSLRYQPIYVLMTPLSQILLNLTQFITLGTESNLEEYVWSDESKTGPVSPRQFAPQCQFLARVGFSDVVHSKYPNKFQTDFKNLIL